MDTDKRERFFEQLLAEPEDVRDEISESCRSFLARALLMAYAPAAAEGVVTQAKLGAYLDGALSPEEAEELLAEWSEIYDIEGARSFLDKVSAENHPVPAELLAAVMAEGARDTPGPAIAARRRGFAPWGWAGGAVAACVLAILALRLSERHAALVADVAPVSTVATLQAPLRPDIASPVSPPPPASKLSERSDALIDGKSFNPVVTPPPPPAARPKRGPQTVYTTPNPPVPLTSHAVTADDYPPDSVRLQEQGAVRIQYTIGTDGAVSDCTVTMSSGFSRLDDAACILVKKWRFKPATVIGGGLVAFTIPAEILFALK